MSFDHAIKMSSKLFTSPICPQVSRIESSFSKHIKTFHGFAWKFITRSFLSLPLRGPIHMPSLLQNNVNVAEMKR